MALVGVEHLRLGGAGETRVGAQRAHAADAEQHLLQQAVLAAPAVQPVGDLADGSGVVLVVGVEQQQRHPADVRHPDARGQRLGARHPDGDGRGAAVVLTQLGEWQPVGVDDRVALLLPAFTAQRLDEVAVPVEQPHAHDRDAQVAGGLEVVAGEDTQAAGVLRQHGGDAELRREVRDRPRRRRLLELLVPPVAGEVLLQVGVGELEQPEELAVARQLVQPPRRDRSEQAHRVVTAALPHVGVDGREQVLCLGVPGPAQVVDQLTQRLQLGGQHRPDRESSYRSHVRTVVGAACDAPTRDTPKPPDAGDSGVQRCAEPG
jgi:hypothetical protein